MITAGDVQTRKGLAAHFYDFNSDDSDTYFCNTDGEMLFVPQQGDLQLFTELGLLSVSPGDIAVVPRGLVFRADSLGDSSRGYLCKNYGAPLTLPERGPIGAICLANPRDFKTPLS